MKRSYEEMNECQMPEPNKDGRVQTLNNMGAMSPEIDPITAKFLQSISDNVLEIGAAYGNVALRAFANPVFTQYVANDLDKGHLEILKTRISNEFSAEIGKLKIDASNFPEDTNLPPESFKAILIARVLHFFLPDKLQAAVGKIYDLLADKGCVYIVGITPYVKKFASFIPVYEQKLASGENWPGYVNNLQEFTDREVTATQANYDSLKDKPFHFLSAELLTNVFSQHHFKITEAKE